MPRKSMSELTPTPRAEGDDLPPAVRPYASLGVHFGRIDDRNAHADECPFCKAGPAKFAVEVERGVAKCLRCNASVNAASFLQQLYDASTVDQEAVNELTVARGFLNSATIKAWGLVQSPLTGEWLFPAHAEDGRLCNLLRYTPGPDGKRLLMSPRGYHVGLLGVPLFDSKAKTTYIAETWNAPALWETLRENGNDANVLGVPGANVFQERWRPLFAGQDVILAVDNDHPYEANGRMQDGAGMAGARRTAGLLAGTARSVLWLKWGPDGYDPDLKSGWDLRDALVTAGTTGKARASVLEALAAKTEPVPDAWLTAPDRLQSKRCTSWRELRNSWKMAMTWTSDLEHMLAMFLAAIISTETVGDGQLWLLTTAPPSSGKTTICDALGVARGRVVVRSVLRPVFSGYKDSKDSTEDFGEVPTIRDKTLVVTDGDPLLKDPNRGLILSQYRGLFDGTAKIKYNNDLAFDYEGVKFTFILCGTAAMRELDAAEVGARFITCAFPEHIDPDHERDVNLRVINRAFRNVRTLANGQPETRIDADMAKAKALTGGYVEHLRANAAQLIGTVEEDVPDETKVKIIEMGEFVAHLRARPSKVQDETTEREFSPRLVEQFARLSVCLAAVLGKKSIDADVLARVRRAALDTARGRAYRYAAAMVSAGQFGVTVDGMVSRTGESEQKVRDFLRFLTEPGIRVAARVPEADVKAANLAGRRWRLHSRFAILWRRVVGATPHV